MSNKPPRGRARQALRSKKYARNARGGDWDVTPWAGDVPDEVIAVEAIILPERVSAEPTIALSERILTCLVANGSTHRRGAPWSTSGMTMREVWESFDRCTPQSVINAELVRMRHNGVVQRRLADEFGPPSWWVNETAVAGVG